MQSLSIFSFNAAMQADNMKLFAPHLLRHRPPPRHILPRCAELLARPDNAPHFTVPSAVPPASHLAVPYHTTPQIIAPQLHHDRWVTPGAPGGIVGHDQVGVALKDLKAASAKAADLLAANCRSEQPITPTGRLAAMEERLNGIAQALGLVQAPLEKLYNSLRDEQKARFNRLGAPSI